MKKLFGIVAVAACLSFGAADQAKAATFYIYFADFCDCITVTRAPLVGHNWFFGSWDWECSGGASSTLIHGIVTDDGEAILGTQPIDSSGDASGFSATIALESAQTGSDHAHITATFDGVTNVLIADEADYFLRTGPPCPGPPNGKPRMFP